ncbi:substrate-binding domain-containing protein [Thaumasiovibrio subtropicus]|uniref:substrate-binding domain-containing protein n=1 Tax=Thaumasiovibrio subtropicus TaxID=1891207 RepID=UPI000B3598AA|nr:substrate-binding domain-containing protein [Thaumasiovibrio subtropicus]
MATIKDVAKAANVSIATVSRVINQSPKASAAAITAVESAMKRLDYRPNANARALVNQSTHTLGIMVGDIADPFFGTMVKTIDDLAHQHGKHLLLGNGYHDEERERQVIEWLIDSRCDALLLHSKALSDETLIHYANSLSSMVIINRHIPEIADRCISFDVESGAFLATEYLIKHGHKNIGFLSSNQDIEDTRLRLSGYRAALQAHQLPYDERFIEYCTPNEAGGEKAMTYLLSKGLPITAIAAFNDYMAAGALSVLEDNAYDVPHQLSLIGFGDSLIASYLTPKLTTVRYPIHMMAERATQLALNLSGCNVGNLDTRQFVPTLVRRQSVQRLTS